MLKTKTLPWQSIDGQVVIIDPEGGQAHELSDVGSLIWTQISENQTEDQIVKSICETYQVDETTASTDFKGFVDNLQSLNLIERI